MICLHCEEPLKGEKAQVCRCKVKHEERPPVVGVNHVSQMLAALDSYRADQLDIEEFEDVFDVFSDYFFQFERRWRGKQTLAARLSPALTEHFGASLARLDKTLDSAARALELLQNLEEAQEDDLDEAEAALLTFFHGICAQGSEVMDVLEQVNSQRSLLDLPSS